MAIKLPPREGDPKKGAKSAGKGFDPKSADELHKRNRANFVDKKSVGRPFKGGGRGR